MHDTSESAGASVPAPNSATSGRPLSLERGLPLLLSTEAAGHLKDTVRVGRMKGRPAC